MAVKIRKNGAWVPIGGDKGDKGEPGQKGEKGFGDKGDQGNKGEKGIGEKGDIGNKGDKGDAIKGNKGDQGNDGDSVKGDKGDPGSKGDKGDVEAKGNKGDKGELGEKGDNKGSKGEPGEKGDVEAKGNKGEPGDKGGKGDKGDFKGSKGDPGDKGDKGDVFAKGVKGDPGDKGEPGDVQAKGVKGDPGQKGQKGEFKGQKGEPGDVLAKGAKGEPSTVKGQKGEPGDVQAKGAKGEPSDVKGQKGEPGQKGAVDEKGNKGEPGTGGVTINNDVNDYVLTATGNPSIIQAESKLRFDGQGKIEVHAGTGDTHIELGMGANNQYAYLDLIGDQNTSQPGGDYGARFLRGNTGANTFSQVVHRGTGELQLVAQDNGAMKFFGDHFGFRNTQRIINSINGYGSANSGFRLITNVYTGWPYNGTAYSYDTGISVNQGVGSGCLIVVHSNTHNPGYNGEHGIYLIRLWESGNHSPTVQVIYQSNSFYALFVSKSSQNTVTLQGQKGSNYFTIMAMGGVVL